MLKLPNNLVLGSLGQGPDSQVINIDVVGQIEGEGHSLGHVLSQQGLGHPGVDCLRCLLRA